MDSTKGEKDNTNKHVTLRIFPLNVLRLYLGMCSVGVKTGKIDTEDTDGDSTEALMT